MYLHFVILWGLRALCVNNQPTDKLLTTAPATLLWISWNLLPKIIRITKQCQIQISAEIAAQKFRSMTSCSINFLQPMRLQDFDQSKSFRDQLFFSFFCFSYQDCKTILDLSIGQASFYLLEPTVNTVLCRLCCKQ